MNTETAKALTVNAKINGKQVNIGIQRHALPYFELDHGPAFPTLQRLMHNGWRVDDVTNVLNFAVRKQPAEGMDAMQWQLFNKSGLLKRQDKQPTIIDDAVRTNGAGTYAVLASMVLYAALYGLPPEDAHFDDAEAQGEAHG